KARTYLSPLVRGEDFPPFKDGLPRYVRLRNVAVPKKLATGFKL
ncbi:MAG: diphosphate--fructose-6-phosphate 1-phosphotransferase, partial [Betaproteobacteria bacterium]